MYINYIYIYLLIRSQDIWQGLEGRKKRGKDVIVAKPQK